MVCGTLILKGTTVRPIIKAMNCHPVVWGPSANEFDPDRWNRLDTVDGPRRHSSFWHGPRHCIGHRLAVLKLKCLLMEVVRRFHLMPVGIEHEVELVNPSVVLRPRNGMKVRMKKIV